VPELVDPAWLRRGELASDDPFAGGDWGLGFSGSELCCAHNPKLSPSITPNAKPEDNLRNMPLFYAAKWCIADCCFRWSSNRFSFHSQTMNAHRLLLLFRTKKQAAQGEALSGLVGEVLRGGGETLSTSTTD
jgi:hypothetical protein